ncbi:hypothetical protein EYF80_010708 [Liparis tanakae]|uniref:Uncharacterized protein n=1 Tax=Liparis tanakae TaxID=230148 RepID=A0A4Z2ILX5_9TELE|nr:hypothetical protein EYF80_010708 [Liparis tanakae]
METYCVSDGRTFALKEYVCRPMQADLRENRFNIPPQRTSLARKAQDKRSSLNPRARTVITVTVIIIFNNIDE